MTVPITTLRTTLATALTDNTKWSTFAFPPQTIIANSVVVIPDDPFCEPSNNSYKTVSFMANFRILMTVPLLDNQGNLNGIEDTLVAVFKKLSDSTLNFRIGTVGAPSVMSAASGDLLTCSVQVTIPTAWS